MKYLLLALLASIIVFSGYVTAQELVKQACPLNPCLDPSSIGKAQPVDLAAAENSGGLRLIDLGTIPELHITEPADIQKTADSGILHGENTATINMARINVKEYGFVVTDNPYHVSSPNPVPTCEEDFWHPFKCAEWWT